MLKAIIFGAILFIAAACSDSSEERKDGFSDVPKSAEDSLFQEVMDGHDAAMAKWTRLGSYRKQVDQKLDSLKKIKSSSEAILEDAYGRLSLDLKDAEEHMNTWMREFSIDSAQNDIEQRLRYLSSEKLKVQNVHDEIMSVVAKADSLLRK